MNSQNLLANNRVFLWLSLAIVMLLLIPLTAMQFTAEVSWQFGDFVIMALMLFGFGSAFILGARRVESGKRFWVGLAVAFGFLLLWTELAVGIFTTWGS